MRRGAGMAALVLALPTLLGMGVAWGQGGDCVAVVVDFGVLAPDERVSVACVEVADGADGSEVLAARARALGTPPPRYDGSGLLCAIDGLPESGCGEQVGERYRYWAYSLGDEATDQWEHASVGPAFREADPAVVEGWHFVEGQGRPGDPPPGVSPSEARRRSVGEEGAAPVSEAGDDDGGDGVVGAAVGAVLVLGLAGTALAVARRRRSS